MRKIILLVLVMIPLLVSCKKTAMIENKEVETSVEESKEVFRQKVGDTVPDFTCETNKGERFTLSKRQKPVFLLVWATW